MSKRVSAIVIALVGVVLIVVALTQNLFAVGPAFEEMIDDFRPALTDESIATLRGDLDMLGGAVEEFQTALAPALATQLGMEPAAFSALMAEQFPAVITGMAVVPEAAPIFVGIIDLLDEQQENFAAADAIPTTSLPATTVPWGIVLVGLIFVGLGAYMFLTETRLSAILTVVVGILVVVGAFGLSLTSKSSGADALNEALKPVYTEETVTGAAQAVTALEAMGGEMQTAMLPGLGAMLGMTDAEVQGFLGAQFPALAGALGAMPDALGRFNGVVSTFDQNLDNYDTLRPVAFAPIIWTVIAGAFIVLVVGAVTFRFHKDEVEFVVAASEKESADA
jgi:hypothetical protein